ncbi:MAG: type II toxin-antitoxin system MqsA family antitoxin [Deltaproteobacteria bacterium]|nr:type II toxin-antitoxin system MqsA family antitoxin [Deltaproteobacteria bacterium]
MKCPMCGAAELVPDARDLPITYKGKSTVVHAVKGDYCPACGDGIIDKGDLDRVDLETRAFLKQVNADRVDPAYIAQVREKLHLNQREAAEIFGGGVNAFSRYETGKATPPTALVKLLMLLDHHPELLNEIRNSA